MGSRAAGETNVFFFRELSSISSCSSLFEQLVRKMAPLSSVVGAQSAALEKRKQLAGGSGPSALLKNLKVFGIACFACLGGLLYGNVHLQ